MIRRRVVLWGLWVATACSVETGSTEPQADPAKVVREYFAAIEAGDCDAMRARLGGPALGRLDEDGCAARLREYEEHGASLRGIDQVDVDGRDADRRLVKTRVGMGDAERTIIIGLRAHGTGWRIERI